MKRVMLAVSLALAGWGGMGLAPHQALAASLCVGSGSGCFTTSQQAIDHARTGDTIRIGAGTFAGGITITVNLTMIGAGAGATIIKGGGSTPNAPVVRIGIFLAQSEPSVSISGVTVTGGANSSDTDAGDDTGGGVKVEPAAGATPGTVGPAGTVVISNSVITGNSVTPTTTDRCGDGCLYASSAGGGIANYGAMTVVNTTVTNNTALTPGPDVDANSGRGGGIFNGRVGTLTVLTSTITGNTVEVGPTGTGSIYSAGGGIESYGPTTIDRSTISNNRVIGAGTAAGADNLGIGGGVHVTSSATIQRSQIIGNSVSMTGPAQNMGAGAGGIDDDGSLSLANSVVSNNHVSQNYTGSVAPQNNGADAGAMEVDGSVSIANTTFDANTASTTSQIASFAGGPGATGGALLLASPTPVSITNSTFTRNIARGTTAFGTMTAEGGAIFNFSTVTMSNSVVTGNSAMASAKSGTAGIAGGGIFNAGSLTLSHSTVSGNSGSATGSGGTAQGGGIWNGDIGNGPPQLTLANSTVTQNRLTASSGETVQGGGLFTVVPVTLTNSVIAQNSPDQCFGC